MLNLASQMRLALQAVRLKLRLLTAYDTFWPALARGGRLIARGRLSEFTRKLFNELPDARDASHITPTRTGPILFLAGHVLGHGGYDHLVLNVLRGLFDSGINVCRDRRSCFRKQLVPLSLRPTELTRRGHPRLVVAPPHLLGRYRIDSRTAVFTMWETDTLPGGSLRQLNRSSLVIVPSNWGARCFRAGGVSVPIEVVPLGYDPAVFHPSPNTGGKGVCTLGTAGALDEGGLRKNVQRVVDLFQQAFPNQDDVRLRVKITPRSPAVAARGDPRIEVLDTTLTTEELAGWYRSLDVFVNASAAEGFGLHLLEALACGVPLISTNYGGVSSFFDSRVGFEVGYRLVEARNAIYGGQWADPDNAQLMQAMRAVYQHRAEAAARGCAGAKRAVSFRWQDTIRKLVVALIRHRFIRT